MKPCNHLIVAAICVMSTWCGVASASEVKGLVLRIRTEHENLDIRTEVKATVWADEMVVVKDFVVAKGEVDEGTDHPEVLLPFAKPMSDTARFEIELTHPGVPRNKDPHWRMSVGVIATLADGSRIPSNFDMKKSMIYETSGCKHLNFEGPNRSSGRIPFNLSTPQDKSLSIAIREIHCEKVTTNDGAVAGGPADEVYILLKEGARTTRIGSEGDRDVIEFKPGVKKRIRDQLFEGILQDGERRQIAVLVNEQEGKIRVTKVAITFRSDESKASGDAVLEMDIDPDDDRIGSFMISLANENGNVSANLKTGDSTKLENGVIVCTGAGSRYLIRLDVDQFIAKQQKPISLGVE